MKRHLLSAAALVLLPAIVHAQDANARVTITVQGATALTSSGITSFGTIDNAASRAITIDPRSPLQPDQAMALLTAQGAPNTNVVVTYDATTDLCHESLGCGMKIVFTPRVFGSQGTLPAASPISVGQTVPLNAQGNFFFWLGGSIQTAVNQIPGAYSGVFNMRVESQ
jgi:hypothetical protein